MESEELVIGLYQSKSYRLLHQRYKTPFAEVDLIFQGRHGNLILVEVKSISNWNFFDQRISRRQKDRLLRALQYFQSQGYKTSLHYAIVSQRGQIRVFTDFFG